MLRRFKEASRHDAVIVLNLAASRIDSSTVPSAAAKRGIPSSGEQLAALLGYRGSHSTPRFGSRIFFARSMTWQIVSAPREPFEGCGPTAPNTSCSNRIRCAMSAQPNPSATQSLSPYPLVRLVVAMNSGRDGQTMAVLPSKHRLQITSSTAPARRVFASPQLRRVFSSTQDAARYACR